MGNFNQNAYHAAWAKEHCRRISLRFNLESDADVIAKLDAQPNIQGYIRELICKDILRDKMLADYLANSPAPTQGYELYNANPYMDKEAEE